MLMNKPSAYSSYAMPRPPLNPGSNHQFYQSNYSGSKIGTHSKMGKTSTLNNHSVLGNNSTMNYYSHLLQPTRMSEMLGAGSSKSSSNRTVSTRTSLKYSSSQAAAKNVAFYRSGDVHMQAFKVAITKRNFRTFDSLLESLSDRIPLPFGVRTISTPLGTHGINRLEEFEDGKSYVCSDKKTVKPLNLHAAQHPKPPWFISKPKTRSKAVAQLIRKPDAESLRVPLRLTQVKTPKKIVIVRNGEPNFRHTLMLSRRTPQSFENILDDVSEVFRMRVHKLYTADGRKVNSLQSLYLGPIVYVAAGREAFQPMEYRLKRVAISGEKKEHSSSDTHSNMNKERTPKEVKKSRGRWKVSIVTSELAAAGTDSHVTITVYGTKGNSGPILLNDGNESTFKSGNEDEFAINVGAIGEIRKVRIAHDNSGSSPGWLCDSITLTDVTTEEILHFPCNRWLSRDEDDGEICRELPANLPNKPPLPYTNYIVSVTTGNLWNSGTSCNVHLTLFGELGDSGPRLLQHGGKPQRQIKGGTDVYKMEAVNLGPIHRIVVGHDGQEKGEGWYLERIVVQEDRVGSEEWVFVCGKWLDAGEDDGMTIRELFVESELKSFSLSPNRNQAEKMKTDSMWDLEKWKFQRGNHIVFISQATEKALRVRSDAGIDGLGNPSLPTSTFEVIRRRNNIRVFSNVGQTSFHIALDQNRMLGHGKGGSFCEFQVKVQPDRTILLESCKHLGQHATVDPGGKPADTRGHANSLGRIFYVYVKGCFRHNSVILLNTSVTQALAITSVGDVVGTGRRSDIDSDDAKAMSSPKEKQYSYFRVLKVAESVRMFQCVRDPKRFIRIKDGQCDGWGNGDVYCHFKIHKYKLGGYVTLQSMKHKGVFIGLNSDGKARPTVDTGDVNTQLYPEVITFGETRREKAEEWRTPEPSFIMSPQDDARVSQRVSSLAKSKLSSRTVTLQGRERSNPGPVDGDFRIYVTTGNWSTTETIILHVYGDKGSSGAITLGKGSLGGVFQCGQTDEFQANLSSIGRITKIRVGVEEVSSQCQWRLKQVKMKDMMSEEIWKFKFNRWISRLKDDGATLRELPALTQDGKPVLPILRYFILVRTSKESARLKPKNQDNPQFIETQHEIYICLQGQNGDTGRRMLLRKPEEYPDQLEVPSRALFAPGQLDRFEIEAVSLGELTKCVISFPTSLSSSSSSNPLSWLCEEIIVRESEGATKEYVFQCNNKWLGIRKVGAKPQVKLELSGKRDVKKATTDTEYKDGDWKISVTTGNLNECMTSANVMFYACGLGATSSGPVFLGSGAKGLFAAGTTEQFKVNLSGVKDIYKVRLSHDNSGPSPSWYVEKIKLQSMTSDETHTLDVRKWLSLDEEPYQLAVEVPIQKPGVETPAVLRYQVLVYTGSILGSDTEANVYISIYGKDGDTGRRNLTKSLNNDIKFQEGQVDIFEVEAVCLGDLTKIEIGHDGIGHGNGWFLHKVIVKESQLSSRDFIFFCNRWLDDGQDDGKIERVIYVEPDDEDDEDNDPAFTSEGKYNVLVTTGTQSSSEPCPVDSEVTMVIYGEEGKTGKILLKPNETDDTTTLQCFKPGQIDEFQIEVPEIGSIYKIRLSINRQCDWSGWFVEEIILEDAATKQRILFNCKRWLSKTEDDQETIREFAVAKKSGKSLPVHFYYVNVTTGDRPGASTDANIYLTLRGERGDSGIRKLVHQGQGDLFPFQRNTTSSFIVEAVDLGKLTEVVISHNGQGYGSGWFVEKISVRESEFATVEWLFLGNMWLDDHIGDCKTVRRLRLLGSFDVSSSEDELVKLESSPNGETPQNASNEYDVTVIVDEVMTEANDVVSLKGKVYGSGGVSETFSLGDWRPGNKKTFTERVDVGPVTEISKIRVEMEDSSRDFNLLLISVTMKNIHTEELLSFNFDRKFRTETGSTVKELPTLRNNKPHKKLMSYYIYVEMSPSSEDAAMMGKLQIKISGKNSDSGFRTLFRGMDGLSAVKRNNGYVFEHEAVDLGELSSIAIVYDTNETNEGGWKVGDVLIRVPAPVNSYATEAMSEPTFKANVDQTFDSTFNQPTSYSLKTCNSNSEINKTFEMLSEDQHKPVRPLSVKSEGTWRLQVTSSSYDEKTLFNQVTAKIFGTRGESDVYSLSSPDFTIDDVIDGRSFDGQVRTKDLKLGSDIGELYLLRLTINKDSLIRIYKAKLKDVATNQEHLAHLTPEERMHKSANEHGVFVFNLPLVKPDQEPFQQHTYEVKVKTGDVPAAATDADIKINIIGTSGETGLRSLKALANHPESLFQLGKIDSFVLESVDVGEPRKVTIGHTASGEGAGWFLDDIIISEVRDDLRQEFNFYCHKWFDDSVDDKLTMRDIYVMGTKLHQSGVDVTKSKGNWKCHIYSQSEITEHKEFDLRLTLCMSENKSQDVVRHISKKHDVIDVQFDHYEPPSPSTGEVTSDFVKIRAQIETSSDDIKKSWPIEECVMVDEDSAEKLRFVFDSAPVWENSARGQLRELPVVRSDRYFQPVINYYVIFYTSSQSPRDFEPSRLTCQLHGQKGTTGWRTLVSNKNSSGKFQPGRVDVFTIEAVSLGDVIDLVSVCVGGPLAQPWTLEKVKVKRDYYDNEEMIFEYNQNISQDEVVELRLSNSVFVYSPKPVATGQNSLPKSGQSQTKFDLEMTWTGLYSLTSSSRDSSETPSSSKVDIPVASLQLTGSKGRSDITSVDLKKANLLSDGKQFYQSKISVSSSELGNLFKVGIGILEPALPVKLIELHPMLCKVTLKNCVTNQYYCFRPNHSFFDNSASSHDNQSGFNWLELAATRPRQDPSTIAESCEYVISIRTSDQPDAGTKANVYIILVGKKADSGKRWLLKSSTGNDVVYTPGEEVEFKISGCNLKDLTQVTIGHDGRDVTSGWHLDQVAVTSSLQPNKQFVFVCKKWLADLQEDTFIERTLELDHVSSQ